MLILILFRRAASDFDGEDRPRTAKSGIILVKASIWTTQKSRYYINHGQHTLINAKTTRFRPAWTLLNPRHPLSEPISGGRLRRSAKW